MDGPEVESCRDIRAEQFEKVPKECREKLLEELVVSHPSCDLRDTWLGINKERLVDGTAELDDAVVRARVPASELDEDDTIPKPCPTGPGRRLLERSAAFSLAAPLFGWENRCVDFAVNHNFTMYSYWSQYPYPPAALAARNLTLETLARIEAFRDPGPRAVPSCFRRAL